MHLAPGVDGSEAHNQLPCAHNKHGYIGALDYYEHQGRPVRRLWPWWQGLPTVSSDVRYHTPGYASARGFEHDFSMGHAAQVTLCAMSIINAQRYFVLMSVASRGVSLPTFGRFCGGCFGTRARKGQMNGYKEFRYVRGDMTRVWEHHEHGAVKNGRGRHGFALTGEVSTLPDILLSYFLAFLLCQLSGCL